jgi:hypothetical protein
MIDPILTQAGAGAIGGVPGESMPGANGPGVASEADADLFQNALNGKAPVGDLQAADGTGTQPGKTMENIDKLSSDLRAARESVIGGTEGLGDMGQLLRLQFEVANLTTTQTMVGQVGQKTSQGTQQLLKGQ